MKQMEQVKRDSKALEEVKKLRPRENAKEIKLQ